MSGAGLSYTSCIVISVNLYNAEWSIGDLARRTGVGISTLRAWERRHGFPVAQRLASGHRRYSERDVDDVLEIERERRAGSTLDAALTRARTRRGLHRASLFATLRQALPHMAPAVLSKRAMLAISRAIEDEAATRAERPVLVGAFQRDALWRASAERWRDLSSSSQATLVLAAFGENRQRGSLFEVMVPPGSPVLREWAVVCDSPTFSAALVGVERLGPQPGSGSMRRFEALWTVEPIAVRDAVRTGCDLGSEQCTHLGGALGESLREPVRATYDSIRAATSITNRIVTYLDRD